MVGSCSQNESLVGLRSLEPKIWFTLLLTFLAFQSLVFLLPQLIEGLLHILRLLRLLVIDGGPLVAHVVLSQVQILLGFVKFL